MISRNTSTYMKNVAMFRDRTCNETASRKFTDYIPSYT